MTYQRQILEYMREHGSITNTEAFKHIGVTRLGSAIFSLRKKGHDITTYIIEASAPDGNIYRYGRYVLEESEEKDVKRKKHSLS